MHLQIKQTETQTSCQEVALFTVFIRKEICLDFNVSAEISPFCLRVNSKEAL